MSTRSSVSRLAGAGLTAACAAGLFLSGCVPPALAQEKQGPPRSVTFWGVATNPNGQPKTGVAGVTFTLYKEEQGGAPLWMETQNVTLDSAGGYTAQIGATHPEGLPIDLFGSGQARWLEVQVDGQPAGQRALLVSVPYALKAVDSQTLGGLPASAFALAGTGGGGGVAPNASAKLGAAPGLVKPEATPDTTVGGGGTANFIPIWTSTTALGSSVIFQKGEDVGIGATPNAKLTVSSASGFAIDAFTSSSASAALQCSNTATSGRAIGAIGTTASDNGTAVQGQATADSGSTFGVGGVSASSSGTGVEGVASATSGNTFGVTGISNSPTGYGVQGMANATSGGTVGVGGTAGSDGGTGVFGESTATSGTTWGVHGTDASSAGMGVEGEALATSGNAYGVVGLCASSDGTGVQGENSATSGDTFGVVGTVASPTGRGVEGDSNATTGNTTGVIGFAASNTGIGVQGQATATTGENYGVYGSASSQGAGVWGVGIAESNLGSELAGNNPAGVWGDTQTGTAGVLATADDAEAIAAYNNAGSVATLFLENQTTHPMASVLATLGSGGSCNIFVNGNLACTGSVGGHAAVPAVAGGTRDVALYAVQAPENWFEDAGSGQLHNGAAVVTLDVEYAATVNTGMDYHVFLTPKGDCKGLYVANETGGSFEVHELGGGKSSIAFDYRIMARRKGFENIRMADLTGKVQKEMSPIPGNGPRPKRANPSMAPVRAARRAPAAVTARPMARPTVVASPAPIAVR